MAKLLCALCAAVGGLAMMPATPASAQETTLVLVIRTGPELTQQFVKEAVEESLKKISPTKTVGGVIRGDVRIRNLTPQEYTAYRRMNDPDAPEVPLPILKSEQIEMRQLPDFDPTWLIKLGGAEAKILDGVTVDFTDETKKPRTIKIEKGKNDLVMTQPGTYVLRLPPGEQPKKVQLNMRDINDKETAENVDWPRGDNFYQIRLNDFRGDQQKFVRVIKDKDAVGGYAMDAFDINKNIVVAVGEAKASSDDPLEDYFANDKLVVVVPDLRISRPERVWMRFPLTKEEADKLVKEWKGKTPNTVSRDIRTPGETAKAADKPYLLKPGVAPKWIEVPRVGDKPRKGLEGISPRKFATTIDLMNSDGTPLTAQDYQELQKQYANPYRVIVYEFDDGQGTVNAIPYKRPGNTEPIPVNASALEKWSEKILQLVGAKETPK